MTGGSHGASSTAASRLLSTTDIWSDAPSPLPAPEPAPVPAASDREPAPVAQAAAPVEICDHCRASRARAAALQPMAAAKTVAGPSGRRHLCAPSPGACWSGCWNSRSIEIDTISGASAGAINALLLASGLAEGGREGAHSRLNRFWARLMHEASFRSLMLVGGFSPAGSSVAFGPTLRSGQFDPFDLDPLRLALSRDINFAALRDAACPKLLIAATRIRDGQQQIFRND